MRNRATWLANRLTKCDTGENLNWLMHPFLFITLVFSVGFTFFGDAASVQSSILYQETLNRGEGYVNIWGLIGLAVCVLHTLALLIRKTYGPQIMRFCVFGGFYLWMWASIIYIDTGYWFQFFAASVPNLFFWSWYAWQWRIRYNNPTDPTVRAFV